MDEDYQELYSSEKRTELLSLYFAAIAIIISCLGLFGLAAFAVQKRFKEISIRMVLGSGKTNIAWLLSEEFLKLIVLALLFALPLSYLLMRSWLQEFVYRINLSLWYFLIPILIIVSLTVLTISTKIIQAIRINPAQSLRNE